MKCTPGSLVPSIPHLRLFYTVGIVGVEAYPWAIRRGNGKSSSMEDNDG